MRGFTINEKRLREQEQKLADLRRTVGLLEQTLYHQAIGLDEAKGLLQVITDYAYEILHPSTKSRRPAREPIRAVSVYARPIASNIPSAEGCACHMAGGHRSRDGLRGLPSFPSVSKAYNREPGCITPQLSGIELGSGLECPQSVSIRANGCRLTPHNQPRLQRRIPGSGCHTDPPSPLRSCG